ncbi:methyl-accepting chemotaxis protein [Aquabacterium sp. OR-4]|uniref:methyl-accepting chemotaxis protein n=1 Tax=Aquabacterium sp. OR-4 TaxID=2978127 RepID=UPI0028C60FBA|nr:methyl-accepting chemotaxis protein [Aquabacterium sp. OR-4]MDT7833636.1 methyl-accepting chemotaxis protein [Aquabacterium sp. OR-4]
MSSIENLSVKARLTLAFGCLAFIVIAVSVLALRALSQGHDQFAGYLGQTASRMALANDILDATNERAISARNLVISGSEADLAAEKVVVVKAHEKVGAAVAKLKDAVAKAPDATERERKLMAEIESVESRYGPLAVTIVGMAVENKREAAIQKMNAECRPLLAALIKAANAYIANANAQGNAEVKEAESAYATNRNLMLLAIVLAGGLAVALALVITRSLTRALGAEPAELGHAAQRVAQGDLGEVHGASGAPAGSVLASLGEMQASLARVVGQVRTASDSIATGSAQIATGNADLSQRTEEQASNLQQTASSMEEMNATVKNNADTARQATQLASSASAAAVTGGQVVGQVVATMDDISTSSKKIADIIGTIDGIAFQTNILALNAAVEAARAGEQGRGFAVVAAEVRSLAQRSAEAAKEIKALISASVERVETGSRLVGEAGTNMDEIVAQVKRVADLIGEISSATIEQTSGIGQVCDAVSQLDQVTQQNAALVEESAAAAESLKHQAGRLAEVVGVFKLGHDGVALQR